MNYNFNKMKKSLLLILLISAGTYVFGQINISPSNIDTMVDASIFDVDLHSDVTLLGGGSIEVEWTRTIVDLPKGWATYVCTGDNCYPPTEEKGSFNLSGSKASPLEVHFNMNNIPGCATVEIKISEKGNPSNFFIATYKICAKMVATSYVNPELIRIYPNPTTEYFKIQNNNGVSKVILNNLLGRAVKVYNGSSDIFDVTDLPTGMYIIQLQDNKGKNIKTSRLSVRKP